MQTPLPRGVGAAHVGGGGGGRPAGPARNRKDSRYRWVTPPPPPVGTLVPVPPPTRPRPRGGERGVPDDVAIPETRPLGQVLDRFQCIVASKRRGKRKEGDEGRSRGRGERGGRGDGGEGWGGDESETGGGRGEKDQATCHGWVVQVGQGETEPRPSRSS